MKVRFLSPNEAVQEFSISTYLKSHNSEETQLKLSRYCHEYNSDMPLYPQLLQCYSTKIKPFSNNEKTFIKFYFKKVHALCRVATGILPKKRKVGLIRLDHEVDWNAPFTINHCIVLPERTLALMEQGYIEYRMAKRSKIAKYCLITLCHEFVHIIQRYPDLYPNQNIYFDNMYRKWGFISINPSQLDWSQVDMTKFLPLRTNPDGFNFQWLFPLRGSLWMPIFGEIGGDDKTMGRMGGALVRIIRASDSEGKHSGRFIVTNEWDYTKNFKDYQQLFYGRDEQLYHPNEIMAVYICNKLK